MDRMFTAFEERVSDVIVVYEHEIENPPFLDLTGRDWDRDFDFDLEEIPLQYDEDEW